MTSYFWRAFNRHIGTDIFVATPSRKARNPMIMNSVMPKIYWKIDKKNSVPKF